MQWTTSISPSLGGGTSGDSQNVEEIEETSMKKLTALLLTLCFTLSIVGCTEEKTTTKAKDATGKTTSATTTEKSK